jgi:endo-1,4-beta-xylanase
MLSIHNATLRSLSEQRGILFGAAVNWRALKTDYAYRDILAEEFNLLTPESEMNYGSLSPHFGAYEFGPACELVNFARANDMRVRGHTLLWHKMNPTWLKESDYNRRQALDLLEKHIYTTTGYFHNEIEAWDVVAEPLSPDGGLRSSFWLNTIGPDYLDYAFRWAHEAEPGAHLFINENEVEGMTPKSNELFEMVNDMLHRGIPVHGIGFQMHLSLEEQSRLPKPPSVPDLYDNMKRISDLGLEIHFTEMDVHVNQAKEPNPEILERQAAVYRSILSTALRNPMFKALILWGVTDRYAWLHENIEQPDYPLPFDSYYQPKPAYEALYHALESA